MAVKNETIAKDSREWRRGSYTSARWMRTFPKKGDRDSMFLREEAFKVFCAPPDADQASRFETKVSRYHEKLATWKRTRGQSSAVSGPALKLLPPALAPVMIPPQTETRIELLHLH